jgi:AraC-like DNA-binding protein
MLQGQSVRQNVIELIGPELSSQNVSIDRIARKMGLASWSLRRRLLAEGYRFQDLLDETRKTMAATYVRDTQHNFTEIAYLLGFANPSGFQRAFRRWTGMSPGEYRLHNRDYPNPA